MSPGSLHLRWHTQDIIHCIFHCVLEPPWHVKLTLIMRDLLGTQQRLSVQTPQYVGLNFLVLVQPESFSFSAFFAWNLGRQVFPFGTYEGKSVINILYYLNLCQYLKRIWVTCHLHTLDHALLTRSQQTQTPVLPHLTFAVVVVDAHRDAQATGFGAGAPGGGLDQTVLLPG